MAPNPSSVAFSDRRHTFLPREETDRIARGLGLAWDQGAGTRDLRGQRHFFRQPPACLLLFPPFGWDVKSGTPRSEVAEECLVSVQFEQVSGREHVLPRLWPNKGKRVPRPFCTVRPAGSLDFGKAYLQLPAGGCLLWGIFPIGLLSPPAPEEGEQGTPNDVYVSHTLPFLHHCTQDNLAGLEKIASG